MLNNCTIMGRLAHDAEIKKTAGDIAVTSFSVAVARDYAKPGEERQTDWLDVVAWGKTAEFIARNFHKGKAIIVSGRIQSRSYEDRSGNKRKAVEIVAERVFFAGNKEPAEDEKTRPVAAQAVSEGNAFATIDDTEDLPF